MFFKKSGNEKEKDFNEITQANFFIKLLKFIFSYSIPLIAFVII